MRTETIAGQMHSTIKNTDNILLLTHEEPDIDALSSVFAFSHYLETMQKNHTVHLREVPLGAYDEFLSRHTFETNLSGDSIKNFSLIIIFDSGDLRHTGIEESLSSVRNKIQIFNIDHHPTNTFFGTLNLVSTEAVSTTEIVYHYFRHAKHAMTKLQSSLLLAGILGDTNNFTNHNTTPESLEVASNLLRYGVSLEKIANFIKPKKSPESLQNWGKIFSRLAINKKYNIALTVITKDDVEGNGTNREMFRGISNYLNNVSGVRVSVVLKETPQGVIRVSMRSNDDLLDLSKFVKIFNGGGHKKAAGFSIRGRLVKTDTRWKIV